MIACAPGWAEPMAERGLYSRFVAFAGIALPLGALAILATLFLLAREPGTGGPPPETPADFEEIARGPRIGGAEYAGLTSDGTEIRFRAEAARPGRDGPAVAEGVEARLGFAGGDALEITASGGQLDLSAGSATLAGDVVLNASTGYRILTESLTTWLDDTRLETAGPLVATGLPGQLEAGQMVLSPDPASPGSYLLVFKSGVRLVYRPQE